MSNLHRIQWIDQQIRRERYPNCSDIAEHFEITRRQASRDIEYLRYSLGAPIEYDMTHRGYMYNGEAFYIPRERLNPKELGLLVALTASYRQMGTNRAAEIATLFQKIHGDSSASPVSSKAPETPHRQVAIETAMREQKDVMITYVGSSNARTERRITPLRLIQRDDQEIVEAFCHLRSAIRQFHLDRIRSARLLNRDTTILGITKRKTVCSDDYLVQIDNEPQLQFHRVPYSARIRIGVHLTVTRTYQFYNSSYLFAWLITHISRFEIESPEWLRKKAKSFFRSLTLLHE